MTEESQVEEVVKVEKPKRSKKKPAAKPEKKAEGIFFDDDSTAVTIYCKYNDRERFAHRLYEERGIAGKGLLLKCDKCGTSILFQAPDRVPTMNMQCGSKLHSLIKWISID